MKRVFIIHGWDGFPEEGWFPWLKAALEKQGFAVTVPAMPDTSHPKIDAWVGELTKLVGKPDANTYFVGHSIGASAILRYIASLPKGSVVGGAVFVAGWFTLDLSKSEHGAEGAMKIAGPWITTPIDTDAVKKVLKQNAAIFSETDTWVPIENKKMFEARLGTETHIEKCGGQGHFSGGDGVTELPKVFELILQMSVVPPITIDDFSKMEIKMGKILTAERIAGADKLLKLSVDMGGEVRTICSGVAQYYQPEELIGKFVPVIANLAPRVMRGIESKGMILMADSATRPVLLAPIKDVQPGAIVK